MTELTQEYVLNMALRRTKIFPWSYDTKCNLMTIDPRYFEHLGIPAEDCTLTNEQFAQLVHPDDIAGVLKALTLQAQGNFIEDPVSYRLHRGMENGNGSKHNLPTSDKEPGFLFDLSVFV
ncbi:MAG: hypothetical protein ACLTZT_18975 [Butyricimonas faecalis]